MAPSTLGQATAQLVSLAPPQGRPLSCRAHQIAAAIGGGLGGAAMGWFIGGIVTLGGDDAYVAKTRRWIIVGTAVAGAAFTVADARRSFACAVEVNMRVPVVSLLIARPNQATDSLVSAPRLPGVDSLARTRTLGPQDRGESQRSSRPPNVTLLQAPQTRMVGCGAADVWR